MMSYNYSFGFLRKVSENETKVGNLKITKQTSFTDGTPQINLPEAHLNMDNNRIINVGDADVGGSTVGQLQVINQGTPHHAVNLRVGDQRYLRKEAYATDENRTMMADLIFNNNLAIRTDSASGILTITGSSTPTSNNAKIVLNSASGIVEITSSTGTNIKSNHIVDGTSTLKNSINFTTGGLSSQQRRIQNLRRLNNGSEYTGNDYDNDPMAIGDVKAYVFVSGMIIMWAGPVANNFDETGLGINTMRGWALCNGTIHAINAVQKPTPDLRNRFIIGASVFSESKWQTAVTGTPLQVGGSKNASIVRHNHVVNGGSHTHQIVDRGHSHQYNRTLGGGVGGTGHANGISGADNPLTVVGYTGITIVADGGHTHNVSYEGSSDGNNGNLPPFYALAYIIRL
jgi:hypothetical protein